MVCAQTYHAVDMVALTVDGCCREASTGCKQFGYILFFSAGTTTAATVSVAPTAAETVVAAAAAKVTMATKFVQMAARQKCGCIDCNVASIWIVRMVRFSYPACKYVHLTCMVVSSGPDMSSSSLGPVSMSFW